MAGQESSGDPSPAVEEGVSEHDTTDPACEEHVEPDIPDDVPYAVGHCTVCCDGWCML